MHAIDYTLANAKGKLVKVINDLLSPAMVATGKRTSRTSSKRSRAPKQMVPRMPRHSAPMIGDASDARYSFLWLDRRFVSSTLFNNPTCINSLWIFFINHVMWDTVIRRYINVTCNWSWHVFDPTWPSPGSALSHVTAVTARREGGAGEHSRCHDADAPYMLHRCNSQLWLMVIGWWNMVWWCLIL